MRDFTRGFYYGKPSEEDQIYDNNTYIRNAVYMGRIDKINEDGTIEFIQKNKFLVGDELDVMLIDGRNEKTKVLNIWDERGQEMESAPHPKQKLRVKLDCDSKMLKEGLILRADSTD